MRQTILPESLDSPSPVAVNEQLDRVLSSPSFARSPRMTAFLKFIVEQALEGRAEYLKEYTIAVEVFGREPDFDPQTNPVVRVQASKLRRLLTLYYLEDGRHDPVVITIPKGAYVPSWQSAGQLEAGSTASPQTTGEPHTLDDRGVAVVPVSNVSGDAALQPFCDGLTEQLVTALIGLAGIHITLGASSTGVGSAEDAAASGTFGARYLLEGSVRQSDGRMRVAIRLFDGVKRSHQRAEQMDFDISTLDGLAVQDAVAARVRALLALELGLGIDDSAAEPLAQRDAAPSHPERRQITVMACDLVGSTAITAGMDPEDALAFLEEYRRVCVKAIQRYGGHVVRYQGDGLTAYFGYPRAHEDDAERSVHAALAIVGALRLQTNADDRRLEVRVGIATGLVVIGDLDLGPGSDRDAAVGSTPLLADRLQTLASPNTIVIGQRTRRLCGDAFQFESLGEQLLEGQPKPLMVWRVLGVSDHPTRFHAARSGSEAIIAGRDQELSLLESRWLRASAGEGQLVMLVGEAGIGKSRMMEAMRARIGEDAACLHYQCSPYHRDTALYPMIEYLQRACRFRPDDSTTVRFKKLIATLELTGRPPEKDLPILAALLSLDPDGHCEALEGTPERRRALILETLLGLLQGLAEQQPVLVLVEDMHWADPTSREFFELVVDAAQTERMLLLVTSRPDIATPFGDYPHATMLTLSRLDHEASARVCAAAVGGMALPSAVQDAILTKSGGVPLFIEELARCVVDTGLLTSHDDHYELVGDMPTQLVPDSLQDALNARLDQLGEDRTVVQVAAVIGREFSHNVLSKLCDREPDELDPVIGKLMDAGLVLRRGVGAQARYLFKHALIRDAAYESLLRGRRQHMHARVAGILDAEFPEIAGRQPELVAHHLTEAGQVKDAIPRWAQAAARALARSASAEAARQAERGLELLETLPEDPSRVQQELMLQLILGHAVTAARGFAAPEVMVAFDKARQLAIRAGTGLEACTALFNIASYHFVRAEYDRTSEVVDELDRALTQVDAPTFKVLTDSLRAEVCLMRGETTAGIALHACATSFYDPDRDAALGSEVFELEPGTFAHAFNAIGLWSGGFSDQATASAERALELAEKSRSIHSIVHAQQLSTVVATLRRDVDEVRQRAELVCAQATEQGFPDYLGWSLTLLGWSKCHADDVSEGLVDVSQGITIFRATGARVALTLFDGLLAECFLLAGDADECLRVAEAALADANSHGERLWQPELHRLCGEALLLAGAPRTKAVEAFEQAMTDAGTNQNLALELRAMTSLARALAKQRKKKLARDRLRAVVERFEEGWDSADFISARKLLDSLQ